jgi:CRISPR-associated protein Cmr4
MKAILIGMLAETFIHPGTGQVISAIDLPVARERTTDYPFIPGSGKKGGWKSWAKEQAGRERGSRHAVW